MLDTTHYPVAAPPRWATEKSGLGLYLHIPFCAYRCSYCDFNTYTSVAELKPAYAQALAAEVAQVGGGGGRRVSTLFFGGGTPSLMTPAELGQVLHAVNQHFDVEPGAEITLEANPETVDLAYLQALRELGVNRLSFGAQSAVGSELALLGRQHSFERVVTAVALARQAGFETFNIDLIYGVPGQTLASWEESLAAALALDTPHLSLYCLTIEPGTPISRWLSNGTIQPPDPDLAADQYVLTSERLAAAGFEHYEISNWALPGHACAHNLIYWRNMNYLGLGAGAHGHAAGYRYHVVKQPRVYIRRMAAGELPEGYPFSSALAEKEHLSLEEQMFETVMMQLRLLQEGLDLAAFEGRFGRGLASVYGETVAQLTEWGLLELANGRLRLSENGRFLSNQVFHRFLPEA